MKICSFEGCHNKHNARGLCGSHYSQLRSGKPLSAIAPRAVDRGGERRCRICLEFKPLFQFIKQKSGAKGFDTRCKDCFSRLVREHNAQKRAERIRAEREHYEANKAEIDAQRAAEAAERAARKKQREHEYYLANRDKALAYSREHGKRWRAENRDKIRARDLRRRALEMGCESEHYLRTDVFDRDGWICQLCFKPVEKGSGYRLPDGSVNKEYATIDHIIPLSKGGPDTFENVQLAHLSCNAGRQNRDLEAVR